MDYKEFRQNCITVRDSAVVYLCGSIFELPLKYFLTNPTDTDRLFYVNDICAIPSKRNPPKNFKGTVLNIESAGNQPGFVKLKRRDGNSDFQRPQDRSRGDIGGPARVLPQEFKLPFIMRAALYFGSSRSKKSGLDTPPTDETNKSGLDTPQTDESYSVYCPYWPTEAEEWLTRERSNGWPGEKLIARIKKGGCHFVLKPHQSNPHDDTQWRFSFSKAELILIHSWTPVQKHVYHLLRLAKNKVIDDCGGKENTVLRTYHFKTIMLWACEQKPSEFWNENDIRLCVRELLNEMAIWLKEKKCPNYFIPENNMLDALEIDNAFNTKENIETLTDCAIDGHLDSSAKIITTLLQCISSFSLSNTIYEFVFVSIYIALFPQHEKLNASIRDKLYKCECFLPEIKQLHDALVANVKLLSIDNVCYRRANKDYDDILNGYMTAMNASTDESRRMLTFPSSQLDHSLTDMLCQVVVWPLLLHRTNDDTKLESGCELFNFDEDIGFPILPQEQLHESSRGSFSLLRTIIEKPIMYLVKRCVNDLAKQIPSPIYLMSAAYLANFYYTTMNDYASVLRLSKKVYKANSQIRKLLGGFIYFKANLPMIICTDFSALFDEHVRTVIGFVLLYKAASPSTSETVNKVVFPMSPIRFMRYVDFLSALKTDKDIPDVFAYTPDCIDYVNNGTRMIVCFSEAFLTAAMRCQGIKILRIVSKNDDPNVSFGEVLGRIVCRIENSEDFENQELIQMLNSPGSTSDCKIQLELREFGFVMAELEASDLILYFRFKSTEDVKRMQRELISGKAKTVVENDFSKLLSRIRTPISVSTNWVPGDYDRCILGFNHN